MLNLKKFFLTSFAYTCVITLITLPMIVYSAVDRSTPITVSQQLTHGTEETRTDLVCANILNSGSILVDHEGPMPNVATELEFPFITDGLITDIIAFGDIASGHFDDVAAVNFIIKEVGYNRLKAMLLADRLAGGYDAETRQFQGLALDFNPSISDTELLRRYQANAIYKLIFGMKHVLAYYIRDNKAVPLILENGTESEATNDSALFPFISYYDSTELSRTAEAIVNVLHYLYPNDSFIKPITDTLKLMAQTAKDKKQRLKIEGARSGILGFGADEDTFGVAINLIQPFFDEIDRKFGAQDEWNGSVNPWSELIPNQNPMQQRQAIIAILQMVKELRYGPSSKKNPISQIHVINNVWRDVIFEVISGWRYGAIRIYPILLGHIDYFGSDIPEAPLSISDLANWGNEYPNPSDFRLVKQIRDHIDHLIEMLRNNSDVDISKIADIHYDELKIPFLMPELDISSIKFFDVAVFGDELSLAYRLLTDRLTYLNNEQIQLLVKKMRDVQDHVNILINPHGLSETEFNNKKAEALRISADLISKEQSLLKKVSVSLDEISDDTQELYPKIILFKEQTDVYLVQLSDSNDPNATVLRTLEGKRFELQRLQVMVTQLQQHIANVATNLLQMREAGNALITAITNTRYNEQQANRTRLQQLVSSLSKELDDLLKLF